MDTNEIEELRKQVIIEKQRAERFDKRIRKIRSGRSYKNKTKLESELYGYISDIIDGSIQDYIHKHGDRNLSGCRVSLLKRVVGQLCALDVRRSLLRKILATEQEALLETELLLDSIPDDKEDS